MLIGPVAKFVENFNCADRFAVSFRDKSIDEIQTLWDFGDRQTSTDTSPTHIYNSRGIYITTLIITGSNCVDTARDTIHIKATNPIVQVSPVKNFYCKI